MIPLVIYRVTPSTAAVSASPFAGVATVELWHQRLGHPGEDVLHRALRLSQFTCSPSSSHGCRACRLGKHARLPFSASSHRSYFPFQILHLDVWTSPVSSVSGFQYYLVVLDSCTHYVWTFPLCNKSEVLSVFLNFTLMFRHNLSAPFLPCKLTMGRV